jgi:hypothetical protein
MQTLKIVLLIFSFSSILFAQNGNSLEESLAKITGDASKNYVAPVSSAFGANLNTGWVHGAPSAKLFGVDIEIGFVGMATFFSDENKTFSSSGSFRFDSLQAESIIPANILGAQRNAIRNEIISKDFNVSISGPTIVGSNKDSVKVVFPGAVIQGQTLGQKTVVLPVTGYLEELPALPLAVPQLTVGTVYGTSVSLRYLPEIQINSDLGKFKYFGFGLQHNPGAWLPVPLPVNVSAGFFTQTMEVGTIFKSSSTMFGLFASKKFGPGALSIEPYGGFAFESSKIDVSYDVVFDSPAGPQPSKISYSLDGENSARFILGATLKLGLFGISVDYNMAKYSSVSGSFNIKI